MRKYLKKLMNKKLNNEKGLTLIELLAVIVIIAIIAAIAIPAIGNIIGNSQVNALKADGQNALASANIYFTENASATEVKISELLSNGYLDDAGKLGVSDADKVVKVVAGNKISATATNGTTIVKFNAATNKDITEAGTAATTGTPIVQITR